GPPVQPIARPPWFGRGGPDAVNGQPGQRVAEVIDLDGDVLDARLLPIPQPAGPHLGVPDLEDFDVDLATRVELPPDASVGQLDRSLERQAKYLHEPSTRFREIVHDDADMVDP